jgi:D-3-phosphoglycerate dehydrogenase
VAETAPDRRFIIVVPEPFPPAALQVLDGRFEVRLGRAGAAYSEDELARMLGEADAVAIYSRDRITASVLERAPRLRVIAKGGSKPTSNVDLAAAQARGIRVLWTPGANAVGVAEMTLALMLAVVRRVPAVSAHLQAGGWRSFDWLGRELASLRLGLVGLGAIGREVARRYRAFGGAVAAYDPHVDATAAAALGVQLLPLDALLDCADIVSLHCELNPQTAALIDQRTLARMKRGAVLINTARGGLVDEAALLQALDSGQVSAAALDVFAEEPPSTGNRLLGHPRVLATPHVAAFTHESIHRESAWALEDAARVLQGQAPVHMP